MRKLLKCYLLAFFTASAFAVEDNCSDGYCQCVRYCKEQGWWDFGGLEHAGKWFDAAKEKGYDVGSVPHVGSVLVWKIQPGLPDGHVAIVAKIINDNEILVNHANWPLGDPVRYGISVRDSSGGKWKKVSISNGPDKETYGFIYQKGTTVPTMTRLVLYRAGTVGWYPTTPICGQASEWYRLEQKSDGSWKAASVETSSICSEVAPMCYPHIAGCKGCACLFNLSDETVDLWPENRYTR